ncbi:AAC(3) family N-acetyltransferase [Marinomonas sp. 2405UD68-3]|uniref:AAC(3) family N-acetyltransferase n=1 Tax=Marinomonas sp. 2405UD68-3 TaxID=3391835 RepID=UPI0039C9028D
MNNNFSQWLLSFLSESDLDSSSSLIVHSSFKRLSNLSIAAEEVCEILASSVPKGCLLMPTMSWKTVNKNAPNFFYHDTKSHTGILTEIFRKKFAESRSLHPTHSVAALGTNAIILTQEHHLSTTPCSKSSPYGLIENSPLRENCFILFIDVALESCTYIHYFEEQFSKSNYLEPEVEHYILHDINNIPYEYNLFKHNKKARDFHQFGRLLKRNNNLYHSQYNNCNFILLKASNLSDTVKSRFEISLDATLAFQSYQFG